MTATPPKRKTLLLNIVFVVVVLGLLLFLWNAPPETTPRLPQDENHQHFFTMDRKEAESFCESCHQPDGISPLSQDHPPTYRCLFCHKRPE
ncbi:hypothetical protein [Desulfurivibrio alkaliphilus]|uniref:Uncharacterized protein n=1 Tax=Desulfurivibrio alkaliphilus (strain DSM 19089 / UNIQEM U267 / AHT2) TaxID=589865 RepID=D6Z3B1_DESAT|nr:hypothetical protein [Desulfurivibrio alkaliphilus]ADH86036.1 conserved hypothetical protein [Desulfurivibrio alkaliphilus AHT 2]